jgi:hypothetical protein
MVKRQVFYSFHFDNDVMRTQQVRNIGVIEGNTPVSANDWETARRTPGGIEKWIDENMKYKSCVIVLVGSETAKRPWVIYEIRKAWRDGKGVVGIYIHNLKNPRTSNIPPLFGKCTQGSNPFDQFTFKNGGASLSIKVKCYNPDSRDAYNDIANNIEQWIEEAIQVRANA